VLLRRSPLIVLLSLEIMLNAANLALISFARLHGDHDGQIFALAVMAVAASEVVVGLGLIVAIARARSTSTSTGCGAARMIAGAWICLLAPLAARSRSRCSAADLARGAG
jgi:NADH:ubiquinone oxidoreductase subunit K